MKQEALEIDMRFDYSVGTEERFALRRWFHEFVAETNRGPSEKGIDALTENCTATGLLDEPLGRFALLHILRGDAEHPRTIRFPKLSTKRDGDFFALEGSMEIFQDEMLVFEGGVEITIVKTEEAFAVAGLVAYPRLKVNLES